MRFNRKSREEYEEATKLKGDFAEMLDEKCYVCNQENWEYDVGSWGYRVYNDNNETIDENVDANSDSFDYLVNLGGGEGYLLICEKCFNEHFEKYPYRDVPLEY